MSSLLEFAFTTCGDDDLCRLCLAEGKDNMDAGVPCVLKSLWPFCWLLYMSARQFPACRNLVAEFPLVITAAALFNVAYRK